MSKFFSVRNRSFSYLISRKVVWVTLLLTVLLLVVAVISLSSGSLKIPPLDVLKVLLHIGNDSSHTVVINKLRLPRIVVAILVGSSLAVSGAILQGMIRNPLASPDIVGITGGATLGAVSFFYFFAGTVSIHLLPIGAILGAFVSTLLIYAMAWKRGVAPLRLVLIGIGMTAAFTALTYMLLISAPYILAQKSLTFMSGSIYGTSWAKDVVPLLPWTLILMPLAFLYTRHVNVQELGDDMAAGVGSRVQKHRLILLLISVALAGAAVSIGGAIAFIGLMAPHIARKLVGPAFGGVLPVSALLGSLILLLADWIGRTAFTPLDIPAGVFTAAVGAPFFVYLLYRHRHH
ncbi:FecCD family ABC transporter permease [Paenibacillus alba]|uniref:Iron ABC transporter permease n=1 Tax=Paenibacillus alba TaxID=1197127 RepID=A0ABU6G4I3_9BACL|nr:iron ABC transporter permease [Paenibacillus alba]MEC0228535.1 iron ABC transporter permease [Paenibacillus alba]